MKPLDWTYHSTLLPNLHYTLNPLCYGFYIQGSSHPRFKKKKKYSIVKKKKKTSWIVPGKWHLRLISGLNLLDSDSKSREFNVTFLLIPAEHAFPSNLEKHAQGKRSTLYPSPFVS